MPTRINKFIAEQGICSRREADELVLGGLVKLNGQPAKPGDMVADDDVVSVRGRKLRPGKSKRHTYIMLNKPIGMITTTDERKEGNVIDHVGSQTRIFPVGRLDVASSGLLLLTDDGDLANKLTHPRYGHEKEYQVQLNANIDNDELNQLSIGVRLDDGLTQKAEVKRTGKHGFRITLKEGRNRQVRRMVEAVGHQVASLKRIRLATLELGDLPAGQFRKLRGSEVDDLKRVAAGPAQRPETRRRKRRI